MNQRFLAERLQSAGWVSRVLYASGYTDTMIIPYGVLDPGVTLLRKPFSSDQLIRAVQRALACVR